MAQKEKLTELQLRIRQLADQVDQITKEQNYQRVSSHYYFLCTRNVKYVTLECIMLESTNSFMTTHSALSEC